MNVTLSRRWEILQTDESSTTRPPWCTFLVSHSLTLILYVRVVVDQIEVDKLTRVRSMVSTLTLSETPVRSGSVVD